jgi:hypothetical protein
MYIWRDESNMWMLANKQLSYMFYFTNSEGLECLVAQFCAADAVRPKVEPLGWDSSIGVKQ